MKTNNVFLAAAAAALLCLSGCTPRLGAPDRLERIAPLVEDAVGRGEIPGAVVCVTHGGKTVYLRAFGNKQVVPDTVAMTTDVMFDLASVSKCVGTTLAAMQLIQDGRIRLTDDVKRYFPDFLPWTDPLSGERVDLTVRDLMTHSSGLSPYINVAAFVDRFGENQPDSLRRFIATEVRRNFRPGTDFMYSCLNYITLQKIIEKVTGEPLNTYVEREVFAPLGLRHTCYFPLGEDLRTPVAHQDLIALCAPTEVQEDGLPLVAAVHDPIARRINAGVSGNAGVFSDAADLAVLCNALLKGGRPVLSPASVELMCTVPPQNDPSVGRALGWDKKSSHSGPRGDLFDPETTIEHTGYTGTSVVMDFRTQTALIILTNRVHPSDDGAVGRLRAQIANIVASAL